MTLLPICGKKRQILMPMKKAAFFIFILLMPFLPCRPEGQTPLFSIVKYVNAVTFITSEGETVKLEGITTPDLGSGIGKKSLELVKKLLSSSIITKTETDKRKKDRLNHKLVYLYIETSSLPEGQKPDGKVIKKLPGGKYGIFLNAYLVKTGWAKTAITPPNTKYMDFFFELEEKARMDNTGSFKYNPYW